MHRSNIPAVTVEKYWHLNLFNPFIDQLIVEPRERLCKPMARLTAQYLLPQHMSNLSSELWQDIKTEYSSLLLQPSTATDAELEGWKYAIDYGTVHAKTLQEAVLFQITCFQAFTLS